MSGSIGSRVRLTGGKNLFLQLSVTVEREAGPGHQTEVGQGGGGGSTAVEGNVASGAAAAGATGAAEVPPWRRKTSIARVCDDDATPATRRPTSEVRPN